MEFFCVSVDLANLGTIQQLCRRYGIRPDPDAGQHFLVNRGVLTAIVAAAELTATDTVLEVGAGLGALTIELAQRASRVVAVEIDPKLAAAAREILSPYPNVEIITGNFLTLPFDSYKLKAISYKLIANLPYHITGRFFRNIFSAAPRPARVVVMVQAEVAERITASPGKLSVLGVLCQIYTQPRIVSQVSRDDFWPPPAVNSAVLKLDVRTPEQLAEQLSTPPPAVAVETVLRLVKAGFAARRKTLVNNFMAHAPHHQQLKRHRGHILAALTSMGDSPNARAQELTVLQWITLAKKLKNCCS